MQDAPAHFTGSGDTLAVVEQTEDEKAFHLLDPVPELCFRCHKPLMEERPVLHSPFKDAKCGMCHDFHQADQYKRLLQPVVDTCGMCHPDKKLQVDGAQVPHAPIVKTDRSCANCHNPHFGNARYSLQQEPVTELCGQCHKDVLARVDAVSAEKRHGPVRDGKCNACHDPHGTNDPQMLRGRHPDQARFYTTFKEDRYVCLRCHDTGKFSENGTTGFRKEGKSLHFTHVNRRKGLVCRACHDPHASSNEHLINERTRFGRWMFPMNWKREPDGGASCLTACHQKEYYDGATAPGGQGEPEPALRTLLVELPYPAPGTLTEPLQPPPRIPSVPPVTQP